MKENRTEEGYKAKIDYIKQWRKENQKTFSVTLKIHEVDEIVDFLKKHNLSRADFLRNAFDELKNKHK